MAGKFSVEGVFKLTDRMSRPIGKIASQIDRLQARAAAGFNKLSSRLGYSLGKATQVATKGLAKSFKGFRESATEDLKTLGASSVAVGAAAVAGLTHVMKTGADFEKTLLDAGNKFEPGIQKNSELFKKLSDAAQDVGGKTEFSSSQAAQALNDLAGAGFDADQAISGLPKVVNFATAASLDLAEASDVAVKSLGAYDMKSDDPVILAKNLQRVTDVLMKTDALSSTNIPAIFEAMKEGGPVAKAAGASLETFAAAVSVLGQSGIEGSSAGTQLKDMFLALAAPEKKASKELAALGIKAEDAKGNLRDVFDVLGDLQKKTEKMGTAEKSAAIEKIFGKIPIAGVTALLAKVDELKKEREDLVKSGGQVDLVAGSKRQSTQGSWDNLTSAMEALELAIFQIVGGPMKELIDETTAWIQDIKGDAVPFVKELVAGLQDGFKQAWPAVKGVMDILFDGFGGKSQWLGTVREFATLLGKVAAMAVLVGTVLGGIVLAGIQMATAAVNALIAVWDGLIGAIGAVLFAFDNFFANLAAKWRAFDFAQFGKQLVQGIAQGIKDGANYVLDAVGDMAEQMMNQLKSAWRIRSPSRRSADEVGAPITEGVGVGAVDAIPGVSKQVASAWDTSAMFPEPPRMPAINALSLGSDEAPALPRVSLDAPGNGASAGGEEDSLVITVRAEPGSTAEVTSKPKRAKLSLDTSNSGSL